MNKKGEIYESQAAELLEKSGYRIAARNWVCYGIGEIDIVAVKDDVTVFVEVRARSNPTFGTPAESVTRVKRAKIIKTAEAYIKTFRPASGSFRFDVISIVPGSGAEHIENAFTADGFGF